MSHCYQVSWLNAQLDPDLTYVEGVLVVEMPGGGFALPHAWNERDDGTVVDETLLEVLSGEDVRYIAVRHGTDLTFTELNERGNPPDLVELADKQRLLHMKEGAHE